MTEAKKEHVFTLRLPTSTNRQAREISALVGVSINQFICTAIAEKITDLEGKAKSARRAGRRLAQAKGRSVPIA